MKRFVNVVMCIGISSVRESGGRSIAFLSLSITFAEVPRLATALTRTTYHRIGVRGETFGMTVIISTAFSSDHHVLPPD